MLFGRAFLCGVFPGNITTDSPTPIGERESSKINPAAVGLTVLETFTRPSRLRILMRISPARLPLDGGIWKRVLPGPTIFEKIVLKAISALTVI